MGVSLWPNVYDEHLKEIQAVRREYRNRDWLSLFVTIVAFPTQPCNLHVSEPQLRLMLRRNMSAGSRRYGTCFQSPEVGDLALYGTEIVVKHIQVLPDGS